VLSSFPVSDIKRTLDAMSWVKVCLDSDIGDIGRFFQILRSIRSTGMSLIVRASLLGSPDSRNYPRKVHIRLMRYIARAMYKTLSHMLAQ
jgi:hypothetical protein